MFNSSKLAAGILPLFIIFLSCTSAYAAPKANLWPYWQNHDANSFVVIDHGRWDAIVKKYVVVNHPSGINRFSYKRVSPEDRRLLKDYLQDMQAVRVSSLNRPEQKAYWINLYNALTVEVILAHYPVKSIRDINISPGLFTRGPWDAKLLTIEGQQISLNDIEHRILRPIWRDNRVHYALNCASLGCPNLQPQAYTSQNMEKLLEEGAREFINHPRGVSFTGNGINVSSIYFWFMENFGGSETGIIDHLKKYLSPAGLEKLNHTVNRLSHHYDWKLNE